MCKTTSNSKRGFLVFLSFFNRFKPKKLPSINPIEDTKDGLNQKEFFETIAQHGEGIFFEDFTLYHLNTITPIDLLMFLPDRGIYFGEKITWTFEELQGAQVERSSKRSNKTPVTRLENTEWKIHKKLEDVLSFDSTPIERFFWMTHMSENAFDTLDTSFHELLPKGRLIFSNDSKEKIQEKFEALSPHLSEPLSKVKVVGSLISHTLLLPNDSAPFGTLLCEEQIHFLNTPLNNPITQLCGDYGSGKSTLLLRKAIQILLEDQTKKIFILTPTKLGGELLRDELLALIEYGAFSVELSSFYFYTPEQSNSAEYRKHLQDSTHLFCDDSDRMKNEFIETLRHESNGRSILLSGLQPVVSSENAVKLSNHYRYDARHHLIQVKESAVLMTLLNLLRKQRTLSPTSQIMVVLDNYEILKEYKTAIDEYLKNNCRILTPAFSLQYQNLDDVILTTPECLSGLSIQHLYLISALEDHDYHYILSRASETATIISILNS